MEGPAGAACLALAIEGARDLLGLRVELDDRVDARPVVVERVSGDQSVIKSGVKAGDIVVTDGQLRLVPGSRVSIKNAEGSKVAS